MKLNNKIKVAGIALLTALVFGSLGSVAAARQSVEVNATAHTANYADYTYSGSYYSGISSSATEGLSGTLRTSLTTLIQPKAWYTYSGSSGATTQLSYQLQKCDEDPSNSSNMIYFYTRDSVTKNAASSWNREHVWPQSLSNGCWGTSNGGTDLLHLRPTYNDTNSKRGNLKYGYATSGTSNTYSGISYGKTTSTLFEPIDSVKGDCARIIMYMWVAYKSYYSSLPEVTNVFESYDTLMKWHLADKPDLLEGNRNDYVVTTNQKNRNPFVDHPEYAWKIFGEKCSSTVLSQAKTTYPEGGSSSGGTTTTGSISISSSTLSLTAGGSGASLSATSSDSSKISWSTTDSSVAKLSSSSSNSGSNITITPVSAGTATIYASATISGTTYKATCAVTVSSSGSSDSGSTDTTSNAAYAIKFKDNGSDLSTNLAANNFTTYIESGSEYVGTLSSSSKAYPGSSGIKLGSSSAAGNFEFTTSSAAQANKINSITVKSAQYNSDIGSLYMYVNGGTSSVKTFTPGTDGTYTFSSPTTVTSLKFATSEKRAYVSEIDLNYTASTTTDSLSLNKSSLSLTTGSTGSITATASGNVTWKSSNTSVATVSASGTNNVNATVSGVAAGSATITATCGTKTATCTVTVTASTVSVTGVTLDKSSLSLTAGQTGTLTATVAPSNATNKNVTWSTSNSGVATVSNGTVTAIAAGSATITVKTSDGSKTATCAVTVTASSVTPSTSELTATITKSNSGLSTTALTAELEKTYDFVNSSSVTKGSITVKWGIGSFNYSSNNEFGIAKNGGYLKAGDSTVIKSIAVDAYKYNNITVNVDGSAVTPTEGSTTNADSLLLTYAINSSNWEIVDNASYNQGIYSIDIIAEESNVSTLVEVSSVSLDKSSLSLEVGQSSSLSATVLPENASNKEISWTTSDSSVATVENGVVIGKGAGTATITVTTASGSKSASCTVTVTAAAVIEGATYDKVTSEQSDWSGKYLLVYESDSSTAYVWNGADATSNFASLSSTGSIASTNVTSSMAILEIASMSGGYSVKVTTGTNAAKYISGTSGSNKLNFNTTASANTIAYDSDDSCVRITSDTSVMTFNSDTTQNRFRYFKSSSYASMSGVQLYKYSESTTTSETAETYATTFLSTITCTGSGSISFSASDWTSMATAFAALSVAEQNNLKNASANAGGSTIEQCVARYDAIVAKYGSTYTNFMSRTTSSSTKTVGSVNDNSTLSGIVSVALIASITLIGSVALTRKRKED